MIISMSFNGLPIETYHLTALQGTLNALMAQPTYKAMPSNENAGIDGTMLLTAPTLRKVAKRDFSLPFIIKSPSLPDMYRDLETLRKALINGAQSTGVNEIYVPMLDKTFRCAFISLDSYNNFPDCTMATINIKFTEINPNNRL